MPCRASSRQSHWPANPPAPVTSARFSQSTCSRRRRRRYAPGAVPREVRVHHHPHELAEVHLRRPSRAHALAFDESATSSLDLGRPHEARSSCTNVVASRGRRYENAASHSCCTDHVWPVPIDVVVGLVLLQHAPHRVDVVAGESPVAARLEVAEPQLLRASELDARDGVGDLARHELESAARALVVEQDAAHGEQAERLAVVHRDPVPVHLRHAVRGARIERRRLALRRLHHLAEHLARAGLVEPRLGRGALHRLEHARHAERGELAGEHRLRPRRRDEALRREVVDLVGLRVADRVDERVWSSRSAETSSIRSTRCAMRS